MTRARFVLLGRETTAEKVTIRDVGPWDRFPTVTNDAEAVVAWLRACGALRDGMRLFYYDSDGRLDEIRVERGRFAGFRPVAPPRRPDRASAEAGR